MTDQEQTEATEPVVYYDEFTFYQSFDEFRTEHKEHNELLISDMNRLAAEIEEYQMTSMILQMLTAGLLGIIIGICFVNIFKKR